MATLKWLLIVGAVAWCGVAALMYVAQRSLMYFPERVRTTPAAAGLPQAEELTLDTADGEKVIAWHIPPRGEKHVALYFHGNGGSLRLRADRFRRLTADGTGLVALSYRGYGGSTGSPTEAGLIADAHALYAFAAARYAPDRLIAWGESLGSGVAIALAAEKPVARVILDAPFTAAVDVAAAAYPFLPVRLLMKDQFRSDLRIARIKVPVLILHGEADSVIPIRFGERLHALIRGPKRLVRFPNGEHVDLDRHGAIDVVRTFLAEKAE